MKSIAEQYDANKGTYYTTTNSAISVNASTWTKVVSLDRGTIPNGRYIIATKVARDVENKIYYARITYNGSDNNVFVAIPYYTGNLKGFINVTDAYTSFDLFIYSQAISIPAHYINIKLIKI